MGKISFENVVGRPSSGVSTVVVGLDDDGLGDSEVVLYVGTKTAAGSPVDMAGLTNGSLFGLRVQGYPTEPAAGIPSGTAFDAYEYGDVSNVAGAALQAASTAHGVTGFNRSEDGAWNPVDNNQFIFVTTASFTTSTRLWRLNFQDATSPAAGGTIDLLVDGATTLVDGFVPKMFDNLTITKDGRYVYMQEDPGNQAHLAKIWRFDLTTNTLELIAEHDPARFSLGGASFMTPDEESSGIIDASDLLRPGKFLLDVQVHKANPNPAVVEFGQLLVMTVSD